jgi:hypothetical protein
VLKHVREAAAPSRLIDGTYVGIRVERDDRRVVSLNDNESQAIVERKGRYLFLERRKNVILCLGDGRPPEQ